MAGDRRHFDMPYTCWALGWAQQEMVVAAHTAYIPQLPDDEKALVRCDGLWGPHDWSRFPQEFDPQFPYLAWIRLPTKQDSTSILYRLPTCSDLCPHPVFASRIVLSPKWIDGLREQRDILEARAQECFAWMVDLPAFRHVAYPSTALRRIVAALVRLKDAPCFWRDIVEAVRGIQRHLLELQAFSDWFRCICSKLPTATPIPTRGSITTDPEVYQMLETNQITVYLRLPASRYHPLASRDQKKGLLRLVDWCSLIGADFKEWRDQGVQAGFVQEHTKELWYYPPSPANGAVFERVARGYAPRRNAQHLTQEALGMQMRREQDLAHERNVINASRPKHTQSSRRLQNAVAPPGWVPKVIASWHESPANTVPIFMDKTVARGWPYHLPPIHLFWGPAEEKAQETFFYHWYCLARCWDWRHVLHRDLAFTPSEWRSLLGDAHWKRQWPKDRQYDRDNFWAHGSELFFGSLSSSGITGMGIINRPLSCGCKASPRVSYDSANRAIILYKLNMAHIYWEFEHHDELQISAEDWDEDRRSRRAEQRRKVWPHGPNYGDIDIGYEYGCQKKDWRDRMLWFEDLRKVMSSWKGFPGILNLSLICLQRDDYIDCELKLITFYQDSFISTHGVLPSLPMQRLAERPPTCAHKTLYLC